MAIPTRAELDALLQDRLAADPAFRDQLLADPRGTVSELAGIDLPELVQVTVHEESLTSVHLVVPASTPASSGELSEEDLELVAGGGMCWDDCAGCSGP
jgi:hypothetical protein